MENKKAQDTEEKKSKLENFLLIQHFKNIPREAFRPTRLDTE